MREDRPVLDLLTANDTFVNERLAKHYGILHIYGSQFRRVALADEARRGFSARAASCSPPRTPIELRRCCAASGSSNLLGTAAPAARRRPGALEPTPGRVAKTMRERMAIHRESPACAGCHRVTDPLGFVLENFDAVGAWRVREAGADRRDRAGPGRHRGRRRCRAAPGTPQAPGCLRFHADREADDFTRSGAGLESCDMPVVREIVRDASRQNYRFSSLFAGIVKSVPFRMRRAKCSR